MSSTDAVSAVEAESNKGNNARALGGRQRAARARFHQGGRDVTRAGYNLLNNRGVTDTSSIRASCGNRLTCQTWSSPQAAADFATACSVSASNACETCAKTQTTPGVGLTPVIQESTRPSCRRCRSW